jgi:trigger factor
MQISVETTEGLERRLRVEIPEERVRGEVDKRLSDMAGKVRVAGFRPGKVPMRILSQRYGKQVRSEVVGEIVQSSFVDALRQEDLQPAGAPRIDPLEAEPGAGVKYTATFDIYPRIELGPVDQLVVTRPTATVEDADLEQMLDTLRRQRRTWETVDREATREDRVVIDFEGFVEGEPLENGSGTDFELELDGARMIPGFESGLIGAKAGESRTLELAFPDAYHHAEVAGKAVRFEVSVQRVEAPQLPEIDQAFAESFGVAEGGVETFRREVRANMERELADALRAQAKQRVMDALLARETVDVPRSLLEQEIEQIQKGRREELQRMGVDPDGVPVDRDNLEAQARRRVSLGLLLAEVIKANEIQVDPERVRARIDSVASTFEDADEARRWFYADRQRLGEVESGVLEEQVVEWLLERAQVTDEPSSFDAILNAGQTSRAAPA